MAEPPTYLINNALFATIFDSCIQTFSSIDAGRTCDRKDQEAVLKITLLGNRLARWEEVYRTGARSSKTEESHTAEEALESIESSLDRLCRVAEAEGHGQSDGSLDLNIVNFTEKLQSLTMGSNESELASRSIWSLHDERLVNEVLSDIRSKIEELEKLSPSLLPTIKQRAEEDAKNLLSPPYTEEARATISLLKTLAAEVDPYLSASLPRVTGHSYEDITALGNARLHQGDFVAEGYSGEMRDSSHRYKNIRAEGNAVVTAGNTYGGKSIFD